MARRTSWWYFSSCAGRAVQSTLCPVPTTSWPATVIGRYLEVKSMPIRCMTSNMIVAR